MTSRFPIVILAALLICTGFSAPIWAGDKHAHSESGADIEMAICHVCRVHDGETEAEEVVATVDHEGQIYGFCSEGCRDKFVEDPGGYILPTLPRPAPDFAAIHLDGEAFSSASLEGQWILLDFWATWCQPCVTDLPKLTALHDSYTEKGFTVLSLSIDEGKRAAKKVTRMAKKRKATHPIVLDSEETPAWAAFQVRVVPTQFLISPEGEIVAQWSGSIDLAVVEAEVARRLGDS